MINIVGTRLLLNKSKNIESILQITNLITFLFVCRQIPKNVRNAVMNSRMMNTWNRRNDISETVMVILWNQVAEGARARDSYAHTKGKKCYF